MTTDEKIQEINILKYRIKKYQDLYPELTYRINIINGNTKKPVRKESLMHHIYKIFRKKEKYSFSQDEYFSCLTLDDDIDFLKLIKIHIENKIIELQKELENKLN